MVQNVEIKNYYREHARIVKTIRALRTMSHEGIEVNADRMASTLRSIASYVQVHLTTEDKELYPYIEASDNAQLAELAARYQSEMQDLVAAFTQFVEQWSQPENLRADPDGFRADANKVLKALFERIKRENKEFYPAVARSQ